MYTAASPDPDPNPNECNSMLTSGIKNIYPYPDIDVNERGHRLQILHMGGEVSIMMNLPPPIVIS